MKGRLILVLNLIAFSVFGQINRDIETEFKSLKDLGVDGIEIFIKNLKNDTTGKRLIDSIIKDKKRLITLESLDSFKIENYIFKQICIQRTRKTEKDTCWNYVIVLSTTYQDAYNLHVGNGIRKPNEEIINVNGKVQLISKPAHNLNFEFPAFSNSIIEKHKLNGLLVKKEPNFSLSDRSIMWNNITQNIENDELLIVIISQGSREMISFLR